jgi:hypothetical protein
MSDKHRRARLTVFPHPSQTVAYALQDCAVKDRYRRIIGQEAPDKKSSSETA